MGQRAMVQLEGELGALAAGEPPGVEPLAAELEALPLVIGADGVMVPFRPHPRTAKGKTRWREIKVAMGVSPSWGRAPYLGRSYRIVG